MARVSDPMFWADTLAIGRAICQERPGQVFDPHEIRARLTISPRTRRSWANLGNVMRRLQREGLAEPTNEHRELERRSVISHRKTRRLWRSTARA